MKKIVSLILVFALTLGCAPARVFAAEDGYTCSDYSECTADGAEIYIITKDGCPIREEPHNAGKIVARAQRGQLISVKRVFWTIKMTRWCEIAMNNGDSLYIHIDNCEPEIHNYITLLENDNGSIDYCAICGVAKAVAEGKTAVCDFTCVLDQSVKGSFSDYNPSFAAILGQIVVGEVLGPIADSRDLVGDIMNGEPGWIIAMDLAAFLPLVGALKYSDEIAILGKNTDDITQTVKYADEIALGGKYVGEIASVATKSDSTKLRKNMLQAFKKTGKDRYYDLSDYVFTGKRNVAAHHIVAGNANNKYAKDSRALLAYVGIDINDAENGIFLIQNSEYADISSLHSGRHSEEYFKTIHDRLFAAVNQISIPNGTNETEIIAFYREAVIAELDDIAEALMNGDIPLN